jgi:oligoendopeptidase F
VNSLWQVRLSDASNFTDNYLNLLKSGGKNHHKDALSPFGLDASDPKFWDIGLNTISSLIDDLEK